MADVIRLLPEAIANQIAAGEVVQRPASVVKELMENSIDAHSQSIQLVIEEAGKQLIQVVDDGVGMSETDARLSFERHATSKIQDSQDLFRIKTMGFRGEALASIAAVAQVELKTRRKEEEIGTKIRIEASSLKEQVPVNCLSGTSIAVKNLFFNVPARRNFLKSNAVEMRYIIEEFQRIALAYPEKSFTLYNNGQEIYQLTEGKLSHRIVEIFGKNYRSQIAPCQEESPLLNITGYIGKPEQSKKTRGEQFFFVNKRFIKHTYLHHAVANAFEGLLPEAHFPFYVLFLEIDPQRIDVNVHPTKTEIKFEDERSVYAIIKTAVQKSLNAHHFAPSIDFDINTNFETAPQKPTTSYPNFNPKNTGQKQHNIVNWEKLYEDFEKNAVTQEHLHIPQEELDLIQKESEPFTFESKLNQMPENSNPTPDLPKEKKVWQAHNRYAFAQIKSGILLLDMHAAEERILYESYLKRLQNPQPIAQQLLFERKIEFNPSDFQIVLEIAPEIRNLGFIFEVVPEKNLVVLKAVPPEIHEDDERLFEQVIEQYKNFQPQLHTQLHVPIAKALANRMTGRNTEKFLTNEEINLLIDKLFAIENPQYALNGKKIFLILNFDMIENWLL